MATKPELRKLLQRSYIFALSHQCNDFGMTRATYLPLMQIRDDGVGFELRGPAEALVQLADAFSEALKIELTPDDGSVLIVEVNDGPVVFSHIGTRARVVGGRVELDKFAHALRFVARGPTTPSSVRYHVHVEHYPEHPWLAPESEPVVISLGDKPERPA